MSKQLTSEQKFMTDVCEGFKDYVLDAMEQDIHLDFEDHLVFLQAAFEMYVGILDDDEYEAKAEINHAYDQLSNGKINF